MVALSPTGRKWLRSGANIVAIATGMIGGLYLVAQFTLRKFNELQERLLRDRVARENLRRRFLQNQEDCNFTIMALLPTLASQILDTINVESISRELQAQSKRGLAMRETMAPQRDSDGAGPGDAPVDAPSTEGSDAPAESPRNAAGETPAEAPNAAAGNDASQSNAETNAHDEANESASFARPALHSRASSLDKVSAGAPPPISANAKLSSAQGEAGRLEDERRATKLRLWSELKLASFERTFTTLYALVFLALETYIQLNLLGRRSYLVSLELQAKRDAETPQRDAVHHIVLRGEDEATPPREQDAYMAGRLSQDTERKYLTSSYWFLHHGWKRVAETVHEAVHAELDDMPLRTIFTYPQLEELVQRIRARIEGSAESDFAYAGGFRDILLPESEANEAAMLRSAGAVPQNMSDEETITPQLRGVLDETKDYIDSPDFAMVFRTACNRVFELLLQNLGTSFGAAGGTDDLLHGARRADRSLLLAKLLPLVAQQAQVALHSSPNNFVDMINEGRELRALSVLIYTAWGEELVLS